MAAVFSKSLKDFGAPSKTVTDAFALEGVAVTYGFVPWKQSFELSLSGSWDGAIGWPYSADRAKTHYYSKRSITSGEWVFFHRQGTSFKAGSIQDLKAYTFGVTLGDWVLDGDDPFTTALRDGVLNYQRITTDEQILLMLARGRIDVFPQQLDVGYHQIKQLVKAGRMSRDEAAQITHHRKAYRKMPLFLLLSRKVESNRSMIEAFNRGLERLQTD